MTSDPPAVTRRPRSRRWIVALAGVVLAGTVAGWIGEALLPAGTFCGWLCDLTSHFRVYTACVAFAGLAVSVRHGGGGAAAILAVAVVIHAADLLPSWLPFGLPVGLPSPPATDDATAAGAFGGAPAIDVICLNVRYSNRDTERVLQYLRSKPADLVALIEVDGVWADAIASLSGAYPFSRVEAGRSFEGIALLSRWPLREVEVVDFGTHGMPSIVATVAVPSTDVTVIATHPRPQMTPAFDHELRHHLREVGRRAAASVAPCLVVGDLNATPWSAPFRGLVASGGLRDSARGRGIQNTWNARLWAPRIPIDHILVSPDVTVVDRRVGPDVGSDHFPVEARVVVRPR